MGLDCLVESSMHHKRHTIVNDKILKLIARPSPQNRRDFTTQKENLVMHVLTRFSLNITIYQLHKSLVLAHTPHAHCLSITYVKHTKTGSR